MMLKVLGASRDGNKVCHPPETQFSMVLQITLMAWFSAGLQYIAGTVLNKMRDTPHLGISKQNTAGARVQYPE